MIEMNASMKSTNIYNVTLRRRDPCELCSRRYINWVARADSNKEKMENECRVKGCWPLRP